MCSHYKSILVSQEQEQEQEQEQAQEQEQEQPIHNSPHTISVIKNSFPVSFSVFHMAEHSYNLFFLVGKC